MPEYNLKSSMREAAPPAPVAIRREVINPFSFEIPEKFLQAVSDLNTSWENEYSKKLTGRLLAGIAKKLLSHFEALEFTFAYGDKAENQHHLNHKVSEFHNRLLEYVRDLDGRLVRAFEYNETMFPAGSEPIIQSMIKSGFFKDLKPNKQLCTLPQRMKVALGMSDKLKPIFTKQQLAQQESLTEAIKTLETLHPFIAEMRNYKIETHIEEVEPKSG